MKQLRSENYLNKFKEIVEYYHTKNNIVIFTDGSGDNRKQDQPIQFGFLIYDKGKLLHKNNDVCNDTFNTSVKSEIMGVNLALEYLISENCTNIDIVVFSDNKFIVDWCINNKSWYSNSTDKAYYDSFVYLREYMKQFNTIKAIWVPREINEDADKLTRK